jgi:hypothetical protein
MADNPRHGGQNSDVITSKPTELRRASQIKSALLKKPQGRVMK